jgi:hypothetical protein
MENLINRIKEVTAWEKRKTKKQFLGKTRGPVQGHQEYQQEFMSFQEELDLMNQSYQSLLKL